MKLEDRVAEIRAEYVVPAAFQGVGKARIEQVLQRIARYSPDMVDCVFSLLDIRPTWFPVSRCRDLRFCDGASTAHIGCHIGILQRGNSKLDREGRDYWIKPLRDVGAIEPVILVSERCSFLVGHPVAKSPLLGYRLTSTFQNLLSAPEHQLEQMLADWISEDAVRMRLEIQARLAEETRTIIGSGHEQLIESCIQHYVPRFLPGFEVVYVDDADGDRVTEEDSRRLAAAGLTIMLEDAMPDVLLHNPTTDALWIIEAVTSDGEVDHHKVESLRRFAHRNRKLSINFTTAYLTWSAAARRQGRYRNVAPDTYIWIAEDGTKHFLAETFTR